MPGQLGDRCQDQLGDAFPALDCEGILSEIDQNDLDLAAIVAVDSAGRVQTGQAMLCRQAGAGPNLDFITLRNGDRQPGRDRTMTAFPIEQKQWKTPCSAASRDSLLP